MTNVGMKTQFTERERKDKLVERVWRMVVISHIRHTRTGQGWCGRWSVSDGIWKVATPCIQTVILYDVFLFRKARLILSLGGSYGCQQLTCQSTCQID